MEKTRNNESRRGQETPKTDVGQDFRKSGPPSGFEGMNFEQQRASYKNSDGGGLKNISRGRSDGSPAPAQEEGTTEE